MIQKYQICLKVLTFHSCNFRGKTERQNFYSPYYEAQIKSKTFSVKNKIKEISKNDQLSPIFNDNLAEQRYLKSILNNKSKQ